MSMPTWQGIGAFETSTTTLTPTMPSLVANDILLLLVQSQANQTVTLSTANGFAQTASSPNTANIGGGPTYTSFWKRAVGSDSAPVIADPGDHIIAVMCCIRGVKTSGNPWNVSSGGFETVADTTGSVPGATTTVANCLVVIVTTNGLNGNSTTNYSAWTNADLANLTERAEQTFSAATIGSTSSGGIGIATGEKVTAGAYTATTFTQPASYKAFNTLALEGAATEDHSGAAVLTGGGTEIASGLKGALVAPLIHGGGASIGLQKKNAFSSRDTP